MSFEAGEGGVGADEGESSMRFVSWVEEEEFAAIMRILARREERS